MSVCGAPLAMRRAFRGTARVIAESLFQSRLLALLIRVVVVTHRATASPRSDTANKKRSRHMLGMFQDAKARAGASHGGVQ